MSEVNTIRWETDGDGIVTLTLDDPGQSANTLNDAFRASFAAAADRLEAEKDSITGVVLASAKKTFFAGGELKDLIQARPEHAAEISARTNEFKSQLRRLETLGKPVVAAISGAALGGGMELTLACHRRIMTDAKGAVIGQPEVSLGLLPGAGGVVRNVRLLGLQDALLNVLLQGQRHKPARALELGLIHEVLAGAGAAELVARAKEWIRENPDGGVQPWDKPGYQIPGGAPSDPAMMAMLPVFPATLAAQLKGAPMPAPRAIMAAAVEGAQVDIETAGLIETRYFVSLVTGQVAKNMTKAFFFDLQEINRGASRPAGLPRATVTRLGVLGAGMMGAAIAYAAARSGIDVVLKDISAEAAAKGKGYAVKLEERALARGRTTPEKSAALLDRITPTADPADFAGVDFVVEAVFEDPALKHKVFGEIQDVVLPDAVLGSNTSTLPVTGLAAGVRRQEDFVGVHFFSPAEKMPLVEIIRGERTSEATLARAFDFAVQLGKTPVVVNDSRGFFTSRVIGTFLNEAVAALGEGAEPASIEQAGLQAGYPAPPLQLMDELTLTLPRKIREATRAAVEAEGGAWTPHAADAVIDRMVVEFGRPGRSGGAGFYEYDDAGKRTGLWPGLREAFGAGTGQVPFDDLRERMLFAEALETVKCFDEGVITSVADANIGSIFGIGFPPWTGGVIQYIDGYPGGVAGFVARARELAAKYGDRFEPPASLAEKASAGTALSGS